MRVRGSYGCPHRHFIRRVLLHSRCARRRHTFAASCSRYTYTHYMLRPLHRHVHHTYLALGHRLH